MHTPPIASIGRLAIAGCFTQLLLLLVTATVAISDDNITAIRTGVFVPNPQVVELRDTSVSEYIRADEARERFDVTGNEIAVVIIDSGINDKHESLKRSIWSGKDLTGNGSTLDHDGHGSGVAGLIAGYAVPGTQVGGGVAPDAKLIPVRIYEKRGPLLPFQNTLGRLNEALNAVLQGEFDSPNHKIGVVHISLGFNRNLSDPNEPTVPALWQQTRQLIDRLADNQIAVVAAAGNLFANHGSAEGMDFPANCAMTVSVGAVYHEAFDFGEEGRVYYAPIKARIFSAQPGRIAAFSQRLSFETGSSVIFTDIFAPGMSIDSVAGFDPLDPEFTRKGVSVNDGTSVAAPLVSGSIALIQEYYLKHRGLNQLPRLEDVRQSLIQGGVRFKDEEESMGEPLDNVHSCGGTFVRLDVVGALERMAKHVEREVRVDQLGRPGGGEANDVIVF